MSNNSIPISTKWLLESTKNSGEKAISAVYLVVCVKTDSKGTGFLIKSGHLITNRHVIKDCTAAEIVAISSNGKMIKFKDVITDENRDLAILTPEKELGEGLEIINDKINIETKVSTWGYPLAYSGPAPILSVGYLAGFQDHKENKTSPIVKRYIVNGAFNPGNSGGPLFIAGENKVIGIVVAKHAPITQFLASALKALANQKSGFQYKATDGQGNIKNFSEAQIVAQFLEHLRKLTQVMIGEAIVASELTAFLNENDINI